MCVVGVVGGGQAVRGARSRALGAEAAGVASGERNEDQVRWL